MLTPELERTIGQKAHAADGDKIGKVRGIYLDDHTEEPTFVTVDTGMFGPKAHFVPVRDARLDGDELVLPYDKDTVKNAPNVDADQHLSVEEERDLYEYYGLTFTERPEVAGQPERVRLRRHVVAEDRTRTAPVREQPVAGREPVADDVRVERVETDPDGRR